MKFIKYVFILAAIINIADVIYLFFKPKPTYEIASFDVNMPVYIIFKLFIAFSFLFLAFNKNAKK